jgi:hypothetical protein
LSSLVFHPYTLIGNAIALSCAIKPVKAFKAYVVLLLKDAPAVIDLPIAISPMKLTPSNFLTFSKIPALKISLDTGISLLEINLETDLAARGSKTTLKFSMLVPNSYLSKVVAYV